MRKLPWVIKYRPKKLGDVVNQEKAKEELSTWIELWLKEVPKERAVLLYGPPGCGKTSMSEALANEYGLDFIEMNASDYRRKVDLDRIARTAALQRSISGRTKLILLDEVDGISGTADVGALETILEIIKITVNPIIMTANNPWDPKLRPLRDAVKLIEFRKLTKTDVRKVLIRICGEERLSCDDDAIDFIAERCEGDLRSAINDLEAVAEGYGKVTLELVKNLLRQRDREYEPFEVVRRIFISKYAWQAKQATQQTDLTPDELIQWINENLPRQISDPEDLWRAYDYLSKADVFMGRIIRTGNWDLLTYAVELMSAGVSLSIINDVKGKYRWVKYSFPQKVLMTARTKEVRQIRDDLAEILAKHLNVSKSVVKSDVIPYMRVIFNNNIEVAGGLALSLNLSESMIRYLSYQNSHKIVELMNKLKVESSRKVDKLKADKVGGKRKDVKGRAGTLNGYFTNKPHSNQ
ncbi:MAG: replication factor C large subunit [Sulfolobales archaeon]|nr:replication factor C large subunit [Sulfolobales archaeon]MCX8185613.1 replication factor C large subunit [Sulfolobales archaeon]MDW7969556.1 replication factor C large subunit [Sulfolobales archaeon]